MRYLHSQSIHFHSYVHTRGSAGWRRQLVLPCLVEISVYHSYPFNYAPVDDQSVARFRLQGVSSGALSRIVSGERQTRKFKRGYFAGVEVRKTKTREVFNNEIVSFA